MTPRKTLYVREEIVAEAGSPAPRPITRAAGIAVIANPFAGRFAEDLSTLIDAGPVLAEALMPRITGLIDGAPMAYGKAGIVGVAGDVEHAAAVLHPKLGQPMRAAVGGGEAIIPSTTKVATAGAAIDVPLGNKDNVWSFDELDTMTVMVADAPRPDEIVIVLAVSDGGRPHPRVGKGRAAV